MDIANKYVYIKDSAGEILGYVFSSNEEEMGAEHSVHFAYDVIWMKIFATRNAGEKDWEVTSKHDDDTADPTIITINLTKYQHSKFQVETYDTFEQLVGEYFDVLL